MSGIWLPCIAVTISTFLIFIFFSKRNFESKEVKIYKYLIILNFLFSINALAVYIISKTIGIEFIVGLMQKFHLSLLVLISYFFFLYILLINNIKKRYHDLIIRITHAVTFILIVLIFLVPVNVINYGEILDVGGYSYFVAMIGVVINFFLIVILNIRYFVKENRKIKKNLPFIALIILFIIGFILRFYYPEVITETYCTTFVFLIMYFTIENPDVRMIEELEIAKNQAIKANHAKTDFLSSMSHEIRTPLNAIVGFSECVASANSLDEAKENAADIISASKTLLEIVNGILDISKIESGKLEIVNSKYDAKKLLKEVAILVRPRIEDKGLDFQMNISEDIPNILYGDYANLKKIITNLLSNAAKYTEHGYVKYEVKCINSDNLCRLIIAVEDSGRGIKEENIDKLFKKFQRLDEDKNTTIEGTGLGLAITKRLLELMGGTIVVQSKYGEGSKFTAIVDQKIEIEEKYVNIIKEENNNNINVSGRNVLIVDDNVLNLKVASKLLEKYNLNIITVDNGFSCVEKINSFEKIDLILMDDMMPKMSGVETLSELKKIKGFCVPVIALTANAIAGMKEKYINLGFDDYLAKPINRNELENIIYKYLNDNKVSKVVDFGKLPEEVYQIGSKGGLIVHDVKSSNSNIEDI